jgi:dihydroorotate dehydrogenase
MYRFFIRPVLFLFDPEAVHHFTFRFLKIALAVPGVTFLVSAIYRERKPGLKQKLFGLEFENPVGLAAGFDKDAKLIDELAALGFGFVEIGTLTLKPQPGNDKPRLFRLPGDEAIINRMGFNNEGVEAAVIRLRNRKSKVIVGGNIGKNKITPNEDAFSDYAQCLKTLDPFVDYFVVNVSSPNTPGLRELQEKEPLRKLMNDVKALSLQQPKPKPVLLKIAPDLTNEQLNDIMDILKSTNTDGVIATNTTISRANLKASNTELEKIGHGGLSGKPLTARSTEVIKYLRAGLGSQFPIIGVGGIMTAQDALEKMEAGANLVQLYTGFIYGGPTLIQEINQSIVRSMRKRQ